MEKERLTSAQAAQRLGVTEHSLRTWRYEGRGPRWYTLGPRRRRTGKGSRPRVFYYAHEVDAFIRKGGANVRSPARSERKGRQVPVRVRA